MPSNRHLLVVAASFLIVVSTATAQPPAPAAVAPPLSPYLNLLRSGGTPAVNYYGLVRPTQAFNQSIQGIKANVAANTSTINDLNNSGAGLPATGVFVAGYQNHTGYFLNQRSGMGATGGGGGIGGVQRLGTQAGGGTAGAGVGGRSSGR